jgi:hypothetical protein
MGAQTVRCEWGFGKMIEAAACRLLRCRWSDLKPDCQCPAQIGTGRDAEGFIELQPRFVTVLGDFEEDGERAGMCEQDLVNAFEIGLVVLFAVEL